MSLTGFWAAVFFFAFAAFTVVSAVIAVKGVGEIRALFRHLEARQQDGAEPLEPRPEPPAEPPPPDRR